MISGVDDVKKAILFDLDGTLLPMDTDEFVKTYMKELAKWVSHIVDPNEFSKALWAGTSAMMKNVDENKINEQVFIETFLPLLNIEKDTIWPTLDEFYQKVFPTFSYLSSPKPEAKQVVESAKERGYKVAIATNPVFPEVATYERIKWAGLDASDFDFVTTYENSYFTKPHGQYYQYICKQLDVEPENCIMVGNDIQEDMCTSKLGMKTYLVNHYIIDRGEIAFTIDDQGTLQDLYSHLSKGTSIFS